MILIVCWAPSTRTSIALSNSNINKQEAFVTRDMVFLLPMIPVQEILQRSYRSTFADNGYCKLDCY